MAPRKQVNSETTSISLTESRGKTIEGKLSEWTE